MTVPVFQTRESAPRDFESGEASDLVEFGRGVLHAEALAVLKLAERLDDNFRRAAKLLAECRGNVLVAGVGKAGRIAQKLADTLCSTGTVAHFLHPADAVHGDLGRVRAGDVALLLSKSGETEELARLLPPLKAMGVPLVAITEQAHSALGRAASVLLPLGRIEEACPLGLAPSTSTTAMLALGDALALAASRLRGFATDDFARLHPGGSLGRKLARVDEYMRPLEQCRVASEAYTLRQVLASQGQARRRVGAVMLVDAEGRLTGFLTDSDVARLLAAGGEGQLDLPVRQVMTVGPRTIAAGAWMSEAVDILKQYHFSELPVVDAEGRPVGLVDRVDLDPLTPGETPPEAIILPAPTLSVFPQTTRPEDSAT